MMIIGIDNLNRDHIADKLILGNIPAEEAAKAQEFCDWANKFSCYDHGGTYHRVVEDNYRLSRGMEDLI